jgi:DNA end-binding protein Ku
MLGRAGVVLITGVVLINGRVGVGTRRWPVMPRAIWSGSISFGLVNVPVKLYAAVQQQDIHFSQFEEGTGARVRNKRVSEKTGKEVPWEKIVKGYEATKGHFITVEKEELESVEPEATHTIDIEDFVSLGDIEPIFYEHTYYLAPSGSDTGPAKAYKVLVDAMEDQEKVGIGRVVLRTKQYLAAIRPMNGVLALSTLLYADEVVDPKGVSGLPPKAKVNDREVKLAAQIIDALTTTWDPERYADTYREQVLDLLERKAKGQEIVVEETAPEPAKVVDLMAALEASLEQSRQGSAGGKKAGTTRKRAPAKRATSTRAAGKKAAAPSRRKSA